MGDNCRADFYVLARPTQSAEEVVCRLAMKAWEQGLRVLVRTGDPGEANRLDELMWDYPPGRFLPHDLGAGVADTPVSIAPAGEDIPDHRDLVINLAIDPVPRPERFRRLCEIVPAEERHREASRHKYRIYREQGLALDKHDLD